MLAEESIIYLGGTFLSVISKHITQNRILSGLCLISSCTRLGIILDLGSILPETKFTIAENITGV